MEKDNDLTTSSERELIGFVKLKYLAHKTCEKIHPFRILSMVDGCNFIIVYSDSF